MTKESSSLATYLGVLRRRRWWVLQALIVIPALAVALSLRQPVLYQGTARVAIDRETLTDRLSGVTKDPSADAFVQILNQEAAIARSPTVGEAVVSAPPRPRLSVQGFLDDSSVKVDERASLLKFSVTSGHRQLASSLPRVYADAYLAYRHKLLMDQYDGIIGNLSDRLHGLALSGASTDDIARALRGERRRVQLLQAVTGGLGSVVGADAPVQVQPRPLRNAVLGLLLGAMLGVLIAFAREAVDRRLRTTADLDEIVDVPVLGQIPDIPRPKRPRDLFVMREAPESEIADAYRALRISTELAVEDAATRRSTDLGVAQSDAETLLITSAGDGEGKTTTACNLAAAFALSGSRVTLVEIDVRRRAAHEVLGTAPAPGVLDVALGDATVDEAAVTIDLEGAAADPDRTDGPSGREAVMRFIPAGGTMPGDATRLRSIPDAAGFFDELSRSSDVVIVDAPAAVGASTLELANHVDAILFVTRVGTSNRNRVKDAARRLVMSHAPTVGLVVTAAQRDPDAPAVDARSPRWRERAGVPG